MQHEAKNKKTRNQENKKIQPKKNETHPRVGLSFELQKKKIRISNRNNFDPYLD